MKLDLVKENKRWWEIIPSGDHLPHGICLTVLDYRRISRGAGPRNR